MEPLKPSGYWDEKILSWESARYESAKSLTGRSLQSRLRISAQILEALPPNQTVVDLGCGSGRLFECIDRSRFFKLVGLDISSIAIAAAREKMRENNVEFQCVDVGHALLPSAEIYIGLGLFDWLNDEEIQQIFSQLRRRKFIFSFSERRAFPLRFAHKMFRRLTAFGRHAGFVPRYHSAQQIAAFAAGCESEIRFYRPSAMAFGSFVSNLPLDKLVTGITPGETA